MDDTPFVWEKASQLSLTQALLATLLPGAVAFYGFHSVLPTLILLDVPAMIAWVSVAGVMSLAFIITAVILLQSEARSMGISLQQRMCLRKLAAREWRYYIGLMIVGMVVAQMSKALIPPFMDAFHLHVPDYMPFFLNPTRNSAYTDSAMPALRGNFAIVPLFSLSLLLNILTEELYFRAWMLPKLSRFGQAAWVLDGIFFALFLAFQVWLLPALLVGSMFNAYVCNRSRSIWPSLAAHLAGEFLFSTLAMLLLVAG